MKISHLNKEKWKGHKLVFTYKTDECYDLLIIKNNNDFSVELKLINLGYEVTKNFEGILYENYLENPYAFGIKLLKDEWIGFLEVNLESWNNRLRITELLILENFRGKGYGGHLINKAKRIAEDMKCRAIVLETQSCNTKAIKFYLSHGFTFCGFDSACYSNDDIEKKEVRLEFIYLI